MSFCRHRESISSIIHKMNEPTMSLIIDEMSENRINRIDRRDGKNEHAHTQYEWNYNRTVLSTTKKKTARTHKLSCALYIQWSEFVLDSKRTTYQFSVTFFSLPRIRINNSDAWAKWIDDSKKIEKKKLCGDATCKNSMPIYKFDELENRSDTE